MRRPRRVSRAKRAQDVYRHDRKAVWEASGGKLLISVDG